jgi:two-component system sensor histidine kinase DegS
VKSVKVQIVADGVITVHIEDEGAGFNPGVVMGDLSGHGLTGIRERLRLIDGDLTIDSAPGKGTRLTAEMPSNFDEQ